MVIDLKNSIVKSNMSASSSTSAAAADMRELKEIVSELKSISVKAKELRSKKKELESRIMDYLEETEAPGLRYKDLVVLKSETTIHAKKKKKDKEDGMIKVLEDLGVEDPKKALDQLKNAMVGEEKNETKLKIKNTVPELF